MSSANKPATGELPRMLSMADISEMFDRASRTIRSWIEKGFLQPVYAGRAVFIPQAQIDALLSQPRAAKAESKPPTKRPLLK